MSQQESTVVFSDEEAPEKIEVKLSWDDVKSTTIPFGIHQGKTYQEMITSRKLRSYLRYLMKWDQLRPYTRGKIECALQEYDRLKGLRPVPELPPLRRLPETLSRTTSTPATKTPTVVSDDDTDEFTETKPAKKRKRKRTVKFV